MGWVAVAEVRLVAGTERMHCWVNDVRGLEVGAEITLRDSVDPTKRWSVEAVMSRRKQMEIDGIAMVAVIGVSEVDHP
ncbi:MAG: hypothetical protein AB7V43_14975 [Acidimicrobiia bacterium]